MAIITSIILLLNIAVWIFLDVVCWYLTGATLGVIGLTGCIGFLIAWGLSGSVTLSLRDYFTQSEWEIFVIKFKWANSSGIFIMGATALICYAFDWLELQEFLS